MASAVQDRFLALLHQETQWAVTCTEPAMVALAAAKARALSGGRPTAVEVRVSPGVMKNARGVGLPGTDRKGVGMAAALGAVAGNPDLGLAALRDLKAAAVREAEDFLEAGRVTVRCDTTREGIFAEVKVRTGERVAEMTIAGSHCHLTRAALDGRPVPAEEPLPFHLSGEDLRELPFPVWFRWVMAIDPDKVKYLEEGANSAFCLAEQVLQGKWRDKLPVPHWLPSPASQDDPADLGRRWVAAAVSARMAGVMWPILTSAGSGNQGILVALPVLWQARALEADTGRLRRALLLAHSTNLFLKAFTGNISALCGAVTAGAGVAAAVCWLLGGEEPEVEEAAKRVLGTLFGMVCDGAKASCASKCAAAAAEGVIAGRLARAGARWEPDQGLLGCSLDETARAAGRLTRRALARLDLLLLRQPGSNRPGAPAP